VKTIQGAGAEKRMELPAGLTWAGVEDNYFLSVLVPDSPLAGAAAQPVVVQPPAQPGRPYRMVPFDDHETLVPSDADLPRDLRLVLRPRGQVLAGTLYMGAKQYERLAKLPWGLEESLQWGIWGFLSRPLLWALLWIHDHLVPNYGWAIMLLTLGYASCCFLSPGRASARCRRCRSCSRASKPSARSTAASCATPRGAWTSRRSAR
jgi:hypothetical protein